MQNEGIFPGDIVVVQKQATARNGQTVIALVNSESYDQDLLPQGEHSGTPSGQWRYAAHHHQAVGQLSDRRDCRRRHSSPPKVRPLLLAPWTATLSASGFLPSKSPLFDFVIQAFRRDRSRSRR